MVGHETSAMTINFILHSLATNLDIQNKLREEIQEVGRSLSYESVNKLVYLDAVIREGYVLSYIVWSTIHFAEPPIV